VNYQTLLLENTGNLAKITLNRPEKRNAISTQMIAELLSALDEIEKTRARVVVLTGTGKAFCAGMDLEMLQAIAQQLTRDRAAIRLKPILKGNATDSAAALDGDQAELAVVRRDRAYPKQGLAVAVLRQNVVVMIVPAPGSVASGGTSAKGGKPAKAKKTEKKIEKVERIAGHTVGVIGRGGANTDLLNLVLKQYEVPADKVKIVSLDPDDVKTALRNKPVDVIFGAGPVTSHFFADAIAAAAVAICVAAAAIPAL